MLISISINANECYQAYQYNDKHKIKTVMDKQIYNEVKNLHATLHVRYLEDNGSSYNIFWLEDGVTDRKLVDINSIYSPFIVKNSNKKNRFMIQQIINLSQDKILEKKLIGIVDILQFESSRGIYRFINSNGNIEVNQTVISNGYSINYLKQYGYDKKLEKVNYFNSDINITLDSGCTLWNRVQSYQKVKINVPIFKGNMLDIRNFNLVKSKIVLDKNHWFFNLSIDISTWDIGTKKQKLSLDDALDNFDSKEKEMLALLDDSQEFEKWIKDNMDFLSYLDVMLEGRELNDEVSKKLFAKLGYIDTAKSTDILSKVTLNVNILEKERFRSLMGLKNTSAPIDVDVLNDIIDYGMSSTNGDDFIKNATGMLIGTIAKERVDRAPEQADYIGGVIIDSINNTQINKTIAMGAAGNMLQTAPDTLVEAVDEVLLSTDDSRIRAKSANALSRIERSNIETQIFQELLMKEENSGTITQLIKASTSAKDFQSSSEFREVLIKLSDNKTKRTPNRVAALKALEKANFGTTKDEKQILRQMMIGEKDSDISKMLKKLYRK